MLWLLNILEGLCLLGSPCITFSVIWFSSLIHFYYFQYSEFMWRLKILEVRKQHACRFHSCKQNSFLFNFPILALEKLCMMKGTELEKKATYFHYFMSRMLANNCDCLLVNKILLNYSFQRAHCAICTDRIWGLGRQGYKCINCKLLVHKKCHKLVTIECGRHSMPPVRHSCLFLIEHFQ